MRIAELGPPLIAYELGNVVMPGRNELPLQPEYYLNNLAAAHGRVLEYAHGDPGGTMRALSTFALFMYHCLHSDQRYEAGRRTLERAVGEDATLAAMHNSLTIGAEDDYSWEVITALTIYVSGAGRGFRSGEPPH